MLSRFLVLICLCSIPHLHVRTAAAATGFIRASNGHFVDEDCNEFVANGLNT